MLQVEAVQLSDAEELTRIYNYYIKESIITFELTPITPADWIHRIEKITSAKYPFLVLRDPTKGSLIGYAYAGKYRERAAYDKTTELSIYLDKEYVGQGKKGYGSILYSALLDQLKRDGYCVAIAGISLPNPESLKFHEKFGFTKVGVFSRVGFKFNEFIDVIFYQKLLC